MKLFLVSMQPYDTETCQYHTNLHSGNLGDAVFIEGRVPMDRVNPIDKFISSKLGSEPKA